MKRRSARIAGEDPVSASSSTKDSTSDTSSKAGKRARSRSIVVDPASLAASAAGAAAPKRKVCLISIDGWGLADASDKGNAIGAAATPHMDSFGGTLPQQCTAEWPAMSAALDASGLAVGLPEGVMGNSEVGHLTMGAGQAQFQDLVRINLAIQDGSFEKNATLQQALEHAKGSSNSRIHFLGLVSDGGVHSHIDHLKAYLKAAQAAQIEHAYVHFFADGRDTPPTSGAGYVRQLQTFMKEIDYGRIGTLVGRYYAMDRDKRWERVQKAYEAMVAGMNCERVDGSDPEALPNLMKRRYSSDLTDEFMTPILAGGMESLIGDHDTLIFLDFRADRMREIVQAFAAEEPSAMPFTTQVTRPSALYVTQTTLYSSEFSHLPVVFPPQNMKNSLAEWLCTHRLSQFHCAETEKYAHVTFFFNGGIEKQYDGEERRMIPSPKVATYDLAPAMSVHAVGDAMVEALDQNQYAFVMCNLAPPDMVGHTGKYNETVEACTQTDKVIGRIAEACVRNDYVLAITSDHGNAEQMVDPDTGKPKTSHTTKFVPLCIVNAGDAFEVVRPEGTLADVAPTVLTLMQLPIPSEMTGKSIVECVRESGTNGAAVLDAADCKRLAIGAKPKAVHGRAASSISLVKSPRKKARTKADAGEGEAATLSASSSSAASATGQGKSPGSSGHHPKRAKEQEDLDVDDELATSAAKKKREASANPAGKKDKGPNAEVAEPRFFYHITTKALWEASKETKATEVRSDSLDGEEGFVHCSTASQLEGTLNRHFAGAEGSLMLLRVDSTKVAAPVKWEVGVAGLPPFPHIYGPIPVDAVVKTVEVQGGSKYAADDLPTE